MKEHFVGFSLYNPEKDKFIYQKNANKHFTPASNQKILALYSALKLLGDSIPALQYNLANDTLVFKGTGNPYFLNSDLKNEDRALQLLKSNKDKSLVYLTASEDIEHYGTGWMWDDFKYVFQTERSTLPIYGNTLKIANDTIIPSFFSIVQDSSMQEKGNLSRKKNSNEFHLLTPHPDSSFHLQHPFITSEDLSIALLEDTLGRKIIVDSTSTYPLETLKQTSFPLYKKMMIESDNFLAEQILLMSSLKVSDTISTSKAISHVKSQLPKHIADHIFWVDGSGLSRYNKLTPNVLVHLLNELLQSYSQDFLFGFFPVGGKSGTLKDWFAASEPYIIAKSGTMTGIYCLSGYLRTKSGKIFIFSFMNNNYVGKSSSIKKEMHKILYDIYQKS